PADASALARARCSGPAKRWFGLPRHTAQGDAPERLVRAVTRKSMTGRAVRDTTNMNAAADVNQGRVAIGDHRGGCPIGASIWAPGPSGRPRHHRPTHRELTSWGGSW